MYYIAPIIFSLVFFIGPTFLYQLIESFMLTSSEIALKEKNS